MNAASGPEPGRAPGRRRGTSSSRPSVPRFVTVRVTASPGGTDTMFPICAAERADPAEREAAEDRQADHRADDRQEDRPVGLGRRRLLEPERVAVLAHRRPERDGRAAADAALGQLGRGAGGAGRGHPVMVPRTARAPGRPATSGRRRRDQRVDVGGRPDGDDRAVGARCPPARPGLARRLAPSRIAGESLVAQPVASPRSRRGRLVGARPARLASSASR